MSRLSSRSQEDSDSDLDGFIVDDGDLGSDEETEPILKWPTECANIPAKRRRQQTQSFKPKQFWELMFNDVELEEVADTEDEYDEMRKFKRLQLQALLQRRCRRPNLKKIGTEPTHPRTKKYRETRRSPDFVATRKPRVVQVG